MGSLDRASIASFEKWISRTLRENRHDRDLGMAKAIGAADMDAFRTQGDGHVQVLRHHGLADGMSVYDLGCGSGRTAQALMRSGWRGDYTGVDIVASLIKHLKMRCPGYEAFVHRALTVRAADASLDMIYHWSVFTHLTPEECYIYLQESFRALRPGGKLVFSFLEFEDPAHWVVFDRRVIAHRAGKALPQLDSYLHRDWLMAWAARIGFAKPDFVDGNDASAFAPFWQSLAAMTKP